LLVIKNYLNNILSINIMILKLNFDATFFMYFI
jgi:hypothetical protein